MKVAFLLAVLLYCAQAGEILKPFPEQVWEGLVSSITSDSSMPLYYPEKHWRNYSYRQSDAFPALQAVLKYIDTRFDEKKGGKPEVVLEKRGLASKTPESFHVSRDIVRRILAKNFLDLAEASQYRGDVELFYRLAIAVGTKPETEYGHAALSEYYDRMGFSILGTYHYLEAYKRDSKRTAGPKDFDKLKRLFKRMTGKNPQSTEMLDLIKEAEKGFATTLGPERRRAEIWYRFRKAFFTDECGEVPANEIYATWLAKTPDDKPNYYKISNWKNIGTDPDLMVLEPMLDSVVHQQKVRTQDVRLLTLRTKFSNLQRSKTCETVKTALGNYAKFGKLFRTNRSYTVYQ